ncbi:MAG: 1-deoxy-D-xylulose-5-phosphate reductoisomerase [Bacteroidales bacterium]|nr:1-deoxy-D-xylulose-5-phosphate reductoisomerase [Bacteroidales bacterium]MDD2280526.1 1-deoxy-D-xylulose-5-phosphate reductoisomerase [Bacteroidales bacterium]MDD4292484.1 1-deoxy-D-xylulose-5-phosphate reductoisomerase [Bacteroidales bacterium]MDD4491764.1 1-deoxy-D-xylulose-5-phosphate reductoisomerase [Bacteroidales bacterium]HPS95246.1 1-deoxy-D-xylulose-5-phosphate reductoisomerase [Bacteroidales bacterium]
MKRKIAILGSTGSIGTQAISVCMGHPDLLQIELLTANTNTSLLIEQARACMPNSVVIADESKYQEVSDALSPLDIKVFTGIKSICDIVGGDNIDMVLTAMVGFSGLEPTVAAIRAGKAIALANKETLVAAGQIVMAMAKKYGAPIIPVDSEHSAIFQCLQGERATVEKIILTASGGPFFRKSAKELESVTIADALNHPNWKMGEKVTVDSASMMNKGLEMIEARWLFNIVPENIEIIVHPQSIIHSMVQFSDGSVTAQMSTPDMRLPIQYALTYPFRADLDTKRVDFAKLAKFEFHSPDHEKFPCIGMAYEAIKKGGNIPCAMNAANEIAVEAFLNGKIQFVSIPKIIENVIIGTEFVAEPTLEDIYKTNDKARALASSIINKHTTR